MDKDYSEYKLTEYDKYHFLRSNRKHITLDYFMNTVRFYPEERQFQIHVDGGKEYHWMDYYIDKAQEEEDQRNGVLSREDTKETRSDREFNESQETKNHKLMEKMKEKYRVDFEEGLSDRARYYGDHPSISMEPFINIFSSAKIDLHYGEGLLDFIYADFQTASKAVRIFWGVLEEIIEKRAAPKREKSSKTKIYSKAQSIADDFFEYMHSFAAVEDIAYASLYSGICPPKFEGNEDMRKKLAWYVRYLTELQKEYLDLIKFCFDESCHPSVLGHLHPAERYSLYRYYRDQPETSRRTERVSFSVESGPQKKMPYGMPVEEIVWRLQNPPTVNDEITALAKELGALPEELATHLAIPHFMRIQYEFGSVAEILELEFTKMLEANVRFRKCKRCGKYFIMKGNYDTNYCDRVAPGETKNCQELAAVENYKAKIADNKALPVYNKYYKRYAARVKVNQIKEADFKKWKYQALTVRDECTEGKISVEEYTQWMEDYFPNRKPKQDK